MDPRSSGKPQSRLVALVAGILTLGVVAAQSFQGLKQETVVNVFGTVLGTRDILDGLKEDFRIPQETTEFTKKTEVFRDSPAELSLGVSSWVPIQISALIQKKPGDSTMRTPVCSVQDEGIDYEVRSKLSLQGSDAIFDYEVLDNLVFLLTSKNALEVVQLKEDKGQTTLEHAWMLLELDKKSTSLLGSVFQTIGLAVHRASQKIYMPTNLGLMVVDMNTKMVATAAKQSFVPFKDIVFTDVLQDYLFVGFASEGVYVYNIKNPDSIQKVGVFDKYFFGLKLEDKFMINHFFVNFHLVQNYQKDIKKQPKTTVGDILFAPKDDTPPNHDIDAMGFPVLLIASNLGVHMVDVTTIKENGVMPSSTYSMLLPVAGASRVIRFHNTIYILQNNYTKLDDLASLKSILTEIILIESDESRFRSTTPAEQLYKVNRVAHLSFMVTNIFADADFFYMVGINTHYVFPRGIPMDSQLMLHSMGRPIQEPNIQGLLTVHIGNEISLLAFGTHSVVDSRVKITDPYIVCQHTGKQLEGEYVFDVNVTTLNCPHKQNSPKIDFKMRATNTCRWSRTLTVTFFDAEKYGYGFFGKTLRVVEYLILIVFVVLLVGLCFFYRRNRLIQSEYERLKREIGVRGDAPSAANHNQEAEYYSKDPNKSGVQQLEFGQVTGAPSDRQEV